MYHVPPAVLWTMQKGANKGYIRRERTITRKRPVVTKQYISSVQCVPGGYNL